MEGVRMEGLRDGLIEGEMDGGMERWIDGYRE